MQSETPYTNKELMAAFVASEIADGEAVSVGASLPVCRAGILLAHLTHAPNLKVQISFTVTNLRNVEVLPAFEFITDWRAGRWGEFYYNHDIGPDLYKRRRQAIFFIGGLQVDAYGNSNLIGIGSDFNHLKMRGPGGVGTASMGTNIGRYYLYLNAHTKQTLTEKLDWRSCVGFADGGADARTSCMLPGAGPRYCITPCASSTSRNRPSACGSSRCIRASPSIRCWRTRASSPVIPDHVPTTPGPTRSSCSSCIDASTWMACCAGHDRAAFTTIQRRDIRIRSMSADLRELSDKACIVGVGQTDYSKRAGAACRGWLCRPRAPPSPTPGSSRGH